MDFEKFLEKITQAKTPRQALSEAQQYLSTWGVVGIAYAGRHIPQPFLYSGRELTRWSERYLDQDYISIDPVVIATRHSLLPIEWCAFKPLDWFNDAQRTLFAEAAAHGQENGLLIPFREEAGGVAVVAYFFGTNPPVTDSERKALLIMTALYLHERVKVSPLASTIATAQYSLSLREMECFAGVQAGQTYAQIGKKLGITERTVTFHLHNGRDKLGASTVTHAITMALQQGLLSNNASHNSSEKPLRSDETIFPPKNSTLSPTDLAMTQWKVSQMSEMISAIAHHWRQPLTVISLSIQNILEEYKANELTAASLEEISAIALASVGKMSQTIFDLTAHSYLRSGLHSTCALRETMETVCFLYPELEALQIEVTGYFLKQRPKPVHLWRAGNRRLMVNLPMAGLRQVIFNLIANARDAIIAKRRVTAHNFAGAIRIKIKVINDFVAISVEDNGGGIQHGALKRIFEPFFTTKERCVGTGIISGSGLGLYQAKLIVEAQAGGTIYAKNGTNGAVITIALPIAENRQ